MSRRRKGIAQPNRPEHRNGSASSDINAPGKASQ
jgi:hypothetical protein